MMNQPFKTMKYINQICLLVFILFLFIYESVEECSPTEFLAAKVILGLLIDRLV